MSQKRVVALRFGPDRQPSRPHCAIAVIVEANAGVANRGLDSCGRALPCREVGGDYYDVIAGDGGPLMWPRITEAQQDSLDATCRKLDRFMRNSAAANKTD